MARYIDADGLYGRVKTHTNPSGKPTLDYKSGVKVLDMINQEPTADVVPKSEVDMSQWLLKDAYKRIEELDELCGELQKSKAEVAREIFEEIEKEVLLSLPVSSYIDAPRTTQNKIWNTIAELKKKYTQVKQ